MTCKQWTVASFTVASLFSLAAIAQAQAPPTIWHALGIPQTFKHMRDATMNKRGNHPGLEKKPPLKALADPANIKSDVPAIKKAAEIKAQEDLAPQKIKALKYLAKIGCGCHGGVAEALAAALEDCTEQVRYEAAVAIGETLSDYCDVCGKTCCTPELAAKMYERAWEQDAQGCWIEPSERVREVLREALNICPPDVAPVIPFEDTPRPMIDRPSVPGVPPMRDAPPPPAPMPSESSAPQPAEPRTLTSQAETATVPPPQQSSRRRGWQNKTQVTQVASTETPSEQPREQNSLLVSLEPPAPAVPLQRQEVIGTVMESRTARGNVRVEFPEGIRPRIGAEVRVYHAYVLGTEQVGSLIIRSYEGHLAVCSPPAWSSGKASRGDEVRCEMMLPAAP